ncbi:hypothetical protein [Escherichia coli]|uniref:hypothetical protein n=1 Tax=Escherichia coli TaxID=562 RepID=UPI00237A5CB9|nr:hypothetical protein [Escherichia coli]
MSNLLSKKDSVFVSDLLREAKVNELDETLSTTRLNHLIDKGYERITLQLDLGGESPGYLEKDKHYREADAALLNVIYPTNLSKINTRRKEQVLKIVKKLAGPGNDSNLLIVFYVQIMPDDFVMQLHRF